MITRRGFIGSIIAGFVSFRLFPRTPAPRGFKYPFTGGIPWKPRPTCCAYEVLEQHTTVDGFRIVEQTADGVVHSAVGKWPENSFVRFQYDGPRAPRWVPREFENIRQDDIFRRMRPPTPSEDPSYALMWRAKSFPSLVLKAGDPQVCAECGEKNYSITSEPVEWGEILATVPFALLLQ